MQSISLQLLDRAVDETLDLESGNRSTPSSALAELGVEPARQIAAKLNVLENAKRDRKINDTELKVVNHLVSLDQILDKTRAKLAAQGIVPLAVLPTDEVWDTLCKSAKLTRYIWGDGFVGLNAHRCTEEENGRVYRRGKLQELIAAAAASVTIFLIFGGAFLSFVSHFFVALPFLVAAGILIVLQWYGPKWRGPLRFLDGYFQVEWLTKYRAEMMSQIIKTRTICDWLDKRFGEPCVWREFEGVTIPLPATALTGQEKLLKARELGMELRVAMPLEAVESFLKGEATSWEEVKRQKSLTYDPVVYYYDHNFVAIIAQFGEFPIKQDAVREAIDSLYAA